MKTGRTLMDLAMEVERQQEVKRDFVAPRTKLNMEVIPYVTEADKVTSTIKLNLPVNGHNESLDIRKLAHQQIATITEIPQAYYNKMVEQQPLLLADNVNTWLHSSPKKNLVRTLDGQVRAMLSDKYQTIDNYDVMEVILPEIQDLANLNLQIVSAEVTETKLYLKIVSPRVMAEVTPGDVVQGGFLVSNSEVGQGNMSVSPFVNRLVCTNGMIVSEYAQKRRHIGKQLEEGDMEIYADDTRKTDTMAFFLKIRDTIRATLEQAKFENIVQKFRESQGVTIHMPEEVVELTGERFGLSEVERKSVFQHLLRGNNMSLWGLANAVTRTAEDSSSYDRASELEAIGSKVLQLETKLVSQRA